MNYRDIQKTQFYKDTYSTIAELKKDFSVNHSFLHVNHVVAQAKKLANLFDLDNNQRRLLYVACVLHDIGYLEGREEHAKNGAICARKFLTENNFDPKDIDIICSAIANHGGKRESDLDDTLSMCLCIADKLDFCKTRYNRHIPGHEVNQTFLGIERNTLKFCNNVLVLEVFVNKKFSREYFLNDYFGKKLNTFLGLVAAKFRTTYEIKFIDFVK